ncbi:N-acyl amino acid synthase FeeM domain-containing protein [Euhalothece natronophila]|nr:GNAT family N-acyltransferase [Euhalothece natronophila]
MIWSWFNIRFDLSNIYRSIALFVAYSGLWIVKRIIWFRGYEVSLAQGRELEEVYRLRYQVYLEKGHIEESPKEIFLDEFDPYSENIILKKRGNGVIGAIRITFSNDHVYLPMQNYFNLDCSSQTMVELGRWVMSKEFRAKYFKSSFLTVIVVLSAYLYLLRHKETYVLFAVRPEVKKYLEEIFHFSINVTSQKQLTQWNLVKRQQIKGYFDKPVIPCEIQIHIYQIFQFIFYVIQSGFNRESNYNRLNARD